MIIDRIILFVHCAMYAVHASKCLQQFESEQKSSHGFVVETLPFFFINLVSCMPVPMLLSLLYTEMLKEERDKKTAI